MTIGTSSDVEVGGPPCTQLMPERGELNFARFDAKLEPRVAELRSELHSLRADLLRWMFGFWISTVLTLGGLMVALRGP